MFTFESFYHLKNVRYIQQLHRNQKKLGSTVRIVSKIAPVDRPNLAKKKLQIEIANRGKKMESEQIRIWSIKSNQSIENWKLQWIGFKSMQIGWRNNQIIRQIFTINQQIQQLGANFIEIFRKWLNKMKFDKLNGH